MGPAVLEPVEEKEERNEEKDKMNTEHYIKLIIERHRLPY